MSSVYCLHPNIQDLASLINYLGISEDSILNTFSWDAVNPSYIFVSEHIYLSNKYFNEFKRFSEREDIVKIYLAGECISPDLNLFDYAIVFDQELRDMDRVHRFPPSVLHKRSIVKSVNEITLDKAKNLINSKMKFCCFIYSNRNAHPMRDYLFYEISKYKQIDSLGKHLHNTEIPPTRGHKNWRELSIEMKSKYKFSIAVENASYEGYTSEKILSSFQAHTVPIYWGNPHIGKEYNQEAFIDCSQYESIEEIIQRIREIDENDELWSYMISQPWQTEEQMKETEREVNGYYAFIEHIFSQDICDAHRVPSGTFPSRYREFFFKSKFNLYLKYSKIGMAIEKVKQRF